MDANRYGKPGLATVEQSVASPRSTQECFQSASPNTITLYGTQVHFKN